MRKIVIAGAGAYHFAPAILEDLFVHLRMPCELWLVDADLDMAELTARGAQTLARAFGVEARFYYTTRLEKAVFSADAVVVCADFLDEEAWRQDFAALDAVGLGKQARLRGGLGGAMQTLRALDVIADLAERMADECPGAPLILCDSGHGGLPLSRACACAQRFFGVRALGVSGAAEQTKRRLSLYLGLKEEDVGCVCAGLNGFSWVSALTDAQGHDLLPRLKKEMAEDSREALSAQYIDWYGAVPAGERPTQYELLADTERSPRRTVPPDSGVGAADYEVRKRNLALLTVHGPLRPEGLAAWGQIRESGLRTARPVSILAALWGGREADAPSLSMPADGAVPGVPEGRFCEGPAHIAADGARGVRAELPVELWDLLSQLSLCNLLYAEAGATGSRGALREALEIDPAYAGIDLLYAEEVLSGMMEAQRDRLKRFSE